MLAGRVADVGGSQAEPPRQGELAARSTGVQLTGHGGPLAGGQAATCGCRVMWGAFGAVAQSQAPQALGDRFGAAVQ